MHCAFNLAFSHSNILFEAVFSGYYSRIMFENVVRSENSFSIWVSHCNILAFISLSILVGFLLSLARFLAHLHHATAPTTVHCSVFTEILFTYICNLTIWLGPHINIWKRKFDIHCIFVEFEMCVWVCREYREHNMHTTWK